MKTGVKLTLGFSFIVLTMLLTVAFCLNTGKKMHEEFEALKDDIMPGALAMVQMEGASQQIAHDLMDYMVAASEEEAVMAGLEVLTKAGTKHLEHEKHIGVDEKKEAEELMVKINRFASACTAIINLKKQGLSTAELLEKEEQSFCPTMDQLLEQIRGHKATHMEELAAAEETVHEAHVSGKRIALLVSAIVAFLAAVIAFATTRSITKPLVALHRGTEIIGSGKLDYKVATDAKDEIGQLSRAFDQMTVNLQKTTASRDELDAANQQLQASEQQLKASNQQLQAGEQHLKAVNQQLESEIAERKKAEEALEASNRELKDFVYIASHDLREPLRKISSFGELLKDSLGGNLNADDQENLEFMIDGAERMTAMIEGLLVYSRLSKNGDAFEAVDLNEIVEQLEQLELAELLEESGAAIAVPQQLPKVQAEPVQIRQLLQNLIANGIKYRREGIQPRVVIRAKQIADGEVRVEVEDNGIGIAKEYEEDVFRMFRRLHSRQEYEGTGIGLAVCKKIVERHNGQIGIESEAGAGSTFWFTLPVSESSGQEQKKLVSSLET